MKSTGKNRILYRQKLFALGKKICRSLGSAASGCGGMGTDDTPIEGMRPSSFGAAGDRLLVHLSSLKKYCMSWRYPGIHTKFCCSGGARTSEERDE